MSAHAEVQSSPGAVGGWPEESILVAVSPSPNSEYLVRWTQRMAGSLKTRWTALHVDTGAPLRRDDGEALQRILELARNLGAEVVTLPSEDVAKAVVRYARLKNAGQIIIGKSDFRRPRFLGGGKTLTEQIVKDSGDIDVLVVQEKASSYSSRAGFVERLRGSPAWHLPAAVLVILAVTAVNLAALPLIGYTSVSIIYLLVITGLVFFFGRSVSLGAPVLSALLWNYLFIPPRLTFAIHQLEDILMFAMFFVAAFTTGFLTSRLKANEKALAAREEKISLLYGFLQSLSEKQTIGEMVETSLAYLNRFFGARTVLFLREEDGRLSRRPHALENSIRISEEEYAAALWCFERSAPAGAYTATPVGAAFHYVPLTTPDSTVGVLGIRLQRGGSWVQEQEDFLLTLGRNLSLSLERELLAQEYRKNLMNAESERLSRIILNTISHEMRTPLTTIKGSITALMDEGTAQDPEARGELLAGTLVASDKLNLIVENLLSMSRLESGVLQLNKSRVDVDELVAAVLDSMKKELAAHPVEVVKQGMLSEIEVDFVLFMQVLANILQNAASHTPAGTAIRISLGMRSGGLSIDICDQGKGVDEAELPRLFDKFFRGSRSETRGCGLGLSICKGIVEAHGGRIEATTGRGGGLCVRIGLPGTERRA